MFNFLQADSIEHIMLLHTSEVNVAPQLAVSLFLLTVFLQ